MNRWQIICPIALLLIVASTCAIVHGRQQQRHYLAAQARQIGRDLLQLQASDQIVHVDSSLLFDLRDFTADAGTRIIVVLGDVPEPIGDSPAEAILYLRNSKNGHLGIRLRSDAPSARFHVLSHWTDPPTPD